MSEYFSSSFVVRIPQYITLKFDEWLWVIHLCDMDAVGPIINAKMVHLGGALKYGLSYSLL